MSPHFSTVTGLDSGIQYTLSLSLSLSVTTIVEWPNKSCKVNIKVRLQRSPDPTQNKQPLCCRKKEVSSGCMDIITILKYVFLSSLIL